VGQSSFTIKITRLANYWTLLFLLVEDQMISPSTFISIQVVFFHGFLEPVTNVLIGAHLNYPLLGKCVWVPVCLSVCLSICLSACLSLSICLSVGQSFSCMIRCWLLLFTSS